MFLTKQIPSYLLRDIVKRSQALMAMIVKTRAITTRTVPFRSRSRTTQRPLSTIGNGIETHSSTKASEGPYLPDLPPPVQGWPSFWMIRKEAEQYLYPLYARGWGVRFLPRKNYLSSHDRYVAYLTTDYSFANFNCVSSFIADLSEMAKDEKHHPSVLTLHNGKRPNLTLLVQTDSAFRPRWYEEDANASEPLSRRVPGISRRDLRFAVLLEEIYDAYYKSGRALEVRGSKIQSEYDRPSWEHLVSRFVRCSLFMKPPKDLIEKEGPGPVETTVTASQNTDPKTSSGSVQNTAAKCIACGGSHKLEDCTVRSHYPPPTLCYLCLEPHWFIDCPDRHKQAFASADGPLPPPEII